MIWIVFDVVDVVGIMRENFCFYGVLREFDNK